MSRLVLLLPLLIATAFSLAGCGCVPEPDPNLQEKPRQCGRGCGLYGVSPVVPYKIEGGHGWR